jgi:hypothetical protein
MNRTLALMHRYSPKPFRLAVSNQVRVDGRQIHDKPQGFSSVAMKEHPHPNFIEVFTSAPVG